MSYPVTIADYLQERALAEATAADGRARCRVYRVERPLVVLGRGSRVEVELDLQTCLDDQVPILRRSGGGCAVVLDPGNLIVAVTLRVPGLLGSLEHFRRLSAWIIAGLVRLGFSGVRREGPSDLVHGDRKIGGACIHRSRDLLHYGVALLVDPRVELMERYLRHPPREPEYRGGRLHREFVGALRPASRPDEMEALERDLQAELRVEELESHAGLRDRATS